MADDETAPGTPLSIKRYLQGDRQLRSYRFPQSKCDFRVAEGGQSVADDGRGLSGEARRRPARVRESAARIKLSCKEPRRWRAASDCGVPWENFLASVDHCLRSISDCHQPCFYSLQPGFKGGKRPSKLGLRGFRHGVLAAELRVVLILLHWGAWYRRSGL